MFNLILGKRFTKLWGYFRAFLGKFAHSNLKEPENFFMVKKDSDRQKIQVTDIQVR